MVVRTFLLLQIVLGIALFLPVTAQVEKVSDIQFCPTDYVPDKQPDLGLSFIKVAEKLAAVVDGFQYPHSVVAGDYLIVMYSVNKESVDVTRIPLNQI